MVNFIKRLFTKKNKKESINVLSLFDGMSCGQLALRRASIKYHNYYASEIEEHAIKVTQHHFPSTIQVGDVTKLRASNLPKIDLLIGGSPCQSFSNAGNGKGFEGESGLFWEYVRLLRELKPKYFLLENVKMKKEWQDIISNQLGVQPIKINSNLVSAQNRERLYWTNIPNINQPENKGVYIEDILDSQFDEKYWLPERNSNLLRNKVDLTNAPDICCIDVYNKKFKKDRKSPTLTLPHHNSLRLYQNGKIRKLTPTECERLQTLPVGYTNVGIADIHRYSMIGNGWTVDVIAHIFKGLKNG
jgi:DNA (cytosine-5)-methyltransferase 3A